MNILILSDRIYPSPNANGICVNNLANTFENKGIKIWNIDRVDNVKYESYHGRIIRFFYNIDRSWNNCQTSYDRFSYLMKRIVRYFNFPRCDKNLIQKYIECCMSYIPMEQIDIIFCVCNPAETVEAALQLKQLNPQKKIVVYNLDTVSDIPFPVIERPFKSFFQRKAYKWECNVFNNADLIINLKCHLKHFQQSKYNNFNKKFLFQEVPLLIKKANYYHDFITNVAPRNIKIIYAGTFYNNIREPELLLSLFKNNTLISGITYVLHIYTSTDYCNLINASAKNNNIKAHAYIVGDAFDQVMESADFLISLGNKDSNMFPSKIVSYISYLKPILHIYQDEKDPVLKFLAKYPKVLFVDSRKDINYNVQKISDFLKLNTTSIDPKRVFSIYEHCTPEYNADELLMRISNL